jgi:hypothetical protein
MPVSVPDVPLVLTFIPHGDRVAASALRATAPKGAEPGPPSRGGGPHSCVDAVSFGPRRPSGRATTSA